MGTVGLGRVHLRASLWALGLVLVVVFWGLRLHNANLRGKRDAARAQIPRVMLLNGYRVPLSYFQLEPDVLSVGTSAAGRLTLLIVTSDTCPVCATESREWMRLLARVEPTRGDRLIVASYQGTGLCDSLTPVVRLRAWAYACNSVRRAAAFAAATGLVATPMTVVLDEEERARIIAKRLTPEAVEMIAKAFSQERRSNNLTTR